jgi:hypothetical protein
VFDVFDINKDGTVDVMECVTGLVPYCAGTLDERIGGKLYDATYSGSGLLA